MRKSKRTTTRIPAVPLAEDGSCSIVFGHNVDDHLVCMLLNVPAVQLIFTPEQAEDVAANLLTYARKARGEAGRADVLRMVSKPS